MRNILIQQRWQETVTALESVQQGRIVDADLVNDWLRSWGLTDEPPTDLIRQSLMHGLSTRQAIERRLEESETGYTRDAPNMRRKHDISER